MLLIIVDGYILSVNVRNMFFFPIFIAFCDIILATLRDIPTLLRITLFYHIIEKITIWYMISQPNIQCVQ